MPEILPVAARLPIIEVKTNRVNPRTLASRYERAIEASRPVFNPEPSFYLPPVPFDDGGEVVFDPEEVLLNRGEMPIEWSERFSPVGQNDPFITPHIYGLLESLPPPDTQGFTNYREPPDFRDASHLFRSDIGANSLQPGQGQIFMAEQLEKLGLPLALSNAIPLPHQGEDASTL